MREVRLKRMATKSRYEAYAKRVGNKMAVDKKTAQKKSVLEALKEKKAQTARPAMM